MTDKRTSNPPSGMVRVRGAREHNLKTVSYTHLTLPTTPYV